MGQIGKGLDRAKIGWKNKIAFGNIYSDSGVLKFEHLFSQENFTAETWGSFPRREQKTARQWGK